MVNDALRQAKVSARNCDRFCAVTGPGSFTGVRVGVSFVRALALAAGRPALGVDAFSAWAMTAEAALGPAKGPVIAALDSRRGTAYVRETPGGPAVEESLDALAARLVRAPGARLTGNIRPPGFAENGARVVEGADGGAVAGVVDLAAVAAFAAAADVKDPAFAPRPFYLRPPDAKPPVRGV